MTALIVIEGVALLLLALLVVGLLRSHAEILRALHRLGVDVEGGGQIADELRVEPRVVRPRRARWPWDRVAATSSRRRRPAEPRRRRTDRPSLPYGQATKGA